MRQAETVTYVRRTVALWKGMVSTVTLVAATAIALGSGGPALAGGFEYNENGAKILGRSGAWGAKADDPMAIHYNPGGLTNWRGHKILANFGLTYLDVGFNMLGMDEFVGPDKLWPSAHVENEAPPFFAPALAWGYRQDDWAVGFGVYGPGAYGKRDFGQGPNQFMIIETDMLLAYVSGSFAYEIVPEFSFGVTLQWVTMPYAKFGLTLDANPLGGDPGYGNCDDQGCEPLPFHLRADIDVADWARFAAIVGMHIRPLPEYEIGISSRVTPIYITGEGPAELTVLNADAGGLFVPPDGEIYASTDFVDAKCGVPDPNNASNTVFDATQPGCRPNSDVSLSLVLPPWLRIAQRYVHRDKSGKEVFDLELDFVVEFWSMLQQYDIAFLGKLKAFSNVRDLAPFSLPKRYTDAFSLRLGSDVHVVPDLFTLHLGAHWESNTQPEAFTNIDFLGFMRAGFGIGFTVQPIPELEISLAYQLVIQPGRTVQPDEADIPIQRPLVSDDAASLPANAAEWETSMYHTGALSFIVHIE